MLAIGLLLSPLATTSDDFPLSTQPMFAAARDPLAEFVTARAFDLNGREIELTIRQIAQTDDPLVAERSLADAVRNDGLSGLCDQIGARLAQAAVGAVAVEVISIVRDLDQGESIAAITRVDVLERCNL